MASDELKEMRKNLTKEAVRDHQMATTGGTQTDLFTCGKCKGKCCTYTQVEIPTCTLIVKVVETFLDVMACFSVVYFQIKTGMKPCLYITIL